MFSEKRESLSILIAVLNKKLWNRKSKGNFVISTQKIILEKKLIIVLKIKKINDFIET